MRSGSWSESERERGGGEGGGESRVRHITNSTVSN